MDLLDFLYPEHDQARHLRDIATSLRGRPVAESRAASRATKAIEGDVGSIALVCMSLVATLVEKGVITEEELRKHIEALDGLDARDDNSLEPNVLRGALGLKEPPTGTLPRNAKLPARKPRAAEGGPVAPRKRKPR